MIHLKHVLPVFFTLSLLMCPVYAETATSPLADYLAKPEPANKWELKETKDFEEATVYGILLTSQTWQDIVWTHQLTIIVPHDVVPTDHVLLFITGGSNKDGKPNWSDYNESDLGMFGQMAVATQLPIAILSQVPNQPLMGDKYEDDLISHTFDQYLKTKDKTLPLLFPMVKSAVKAMDAIQEFAWQEYDHQIDHFVVTGASKRGWTTWLTGSQDKRVSGIAPIVIDVLNMGKQMDYQLEAWGDYSPQIQDYVRLGIPSKLNDPDGEELRKMVDPYAYKDRITIPKFIIIGANDPYWPVDAIKFYFDDLPGKKYIHYTPNVGHDLQGPDIGKEQAGVNAIATFYAMCAENKQHHDLEWKFVKDDKKGKIVVEADSAARKAVIWHTTSTDRDFRNNLWLADRVRTKTPHSFSVDIPYPKEGYSAFFVDVIFPSPYTDGYKKSTRMFVLSPEGLVDKK